MSETQERGDATRQPPRKKAYASPKLTEYGSVAKLTMAKGSTDIEIVPNKKRGGCL